MNKKKIINDPIYGFITIPHDIIFDCLEKQEFQRLRRIKQLGLTHMVYPGAQHTRFQHALGAMHLMTLAIESLRSKQIEISVEEEKAVLMAILLHDIGHGPFSHTLEHSLLQNVKHEFISEQLMRRLNQQFEGSLDLTIKIFKNEYSKKFLHQLVSGQLDMDRLDYLRRDSFYTGVSEGTVGIERIIQMLNVVNDELVVDEKGIYSVEKFIMARRFMYWQVYLHKTSLAAEQLLQSILKRAKYLMNNGKDLFASPYLKFFLKSHYTENDLSSDSQVLDTYCFLDDSDIMSAVKVWMNADDQILTELCKMLVNRKLPKISIQNTPVDKDQLNEIRSKVAADQKIERSDADYFIFSGKLENSTYSSREEQIKIFYKNGLVKDIANTSETFALAGDTVPSVKYFISYPK